MTLPDNVQRLDAHTTTLVVDCGGPGIPSIAYWGARLHCPVDGATVAAARERVLPYGELDQETPLSLLPESGTGFPGQPGIRGCRGRYDWVTQFRLQEVAHHGDSLTIHCRDDAAALELVIELALDACSGVLTAGTRLHNRGSAGFDVQWCAGLAMPLPAFEAELLALEGRWGREFQRRRQPFPDDVLLRENRDGRTSHHCFPGLIMGTSGFREQRGEVLGFHLGWSGNHRLVIERLPDRRRQLQLGELLLPGEVVLAPGESYASPKAYAAWSDSGLSALSETWHDFVRAHILPPVPRPRPVHINTWEAFYFHHDLAQLKRFADQAAELGVERFVLDDGWFKGRDSDRSALGDWVADPHKYPHGLGELIEHVQRCGMAFGLWIEPEMVSPDSDLFRAHPDWILEVAGRHQPLGRQQYVLDLTRPAVSDYLFNRLHDLLDRHPIAYFKWDTNRDLTHPGHEGVAAVRTQTTAVYRLIDALRAAHPAVEIESCASGGGRADFEILRRTHRIWPSDTNDALERQNIQRGFTLFFPPEVMGAHIGPLRAHTTGRYLDFDFQGLTALFGHLGLELDVTALDQREREQIKAHIQLYKQYRELLHAGRSVRLDTAESEALAYGVVARDRSQALFVYAQLGSMRASVPPPLRLAALDHGRCYRARVVRHSGPRHLMKREPLICTGGEVQLSGEWLCRVGVQLPITTPQTALLVHMEMIDEAG